MAFTENASFKSSGVICWSPLPSSLPDELSMDKRDSNGFFSTRMVCMDTTGSSQFVARQSSFLAICACYKLLADTALLYGTGILLDIMQPCAVCIVVVNPLTLPSLSMYRRIL